MSLTIPFADPLTDVDLYWIGYIRADGSLSCWNHYYQLAFTQKCEAPVRALYTYVGATSKLSHYKQGKNPWSSGNTIWKFNTRNYVDMLQSLGVKGQLREDIYQSPHFWRGLIDGDGSVSWGTPSREPDHPYPILDLRGYPRDMVAFSNYVENLGLISRKIIHHKGNISTVVYIAMPAAALTAHFYHGQYSALDYKAENAKRSIAYGFARRHAARSLAAVRLFDATMERSNS